MTKIFHWWLILGIQDGTEKWSQNSHQEFVDLQYSSNVIPWIWQETEPVVAPSCEELRECFFSEQYSKIAKVDLELLLVLKISLRDRDRFAELQKGGNLFEFPLTGALRRWMDGWKDYLVEIPTTCRIESAMWKKYSQPSAICKS